jgi:hypothetical protein
LDIGKVSKDYNAEKQQSTAIKQQLIAVSLLVFTILSYFPKLQKIN